MKKLALTSLLLAGLTQATGCIIVTDDSSGAVIEVEWDLVNRGDVVSCSSENATTVHITATDSFGATTTADFACADGVGDFAPLPLDTYDIDVQLLDGTGTILGEVFFNNITLANDGDTVVNGPAHFDFSRYDVSFIVDYGNAGGDNCTATSAGGSGVVQQAVTLVAEGAGSCTPYTLTLGAGTTTNDTCGSVDVCQENVSAETQVIQDVPPGNYTVSVTGFKGALSAATYECYHGTSSFNLPNNSPDDFQINSAGASSGVILAPFSPTPADDANCNAIKRQP